MPLAQEKKEIKGIVAEYKEKGYTEAEAKDIANAVVFGKQRGLTKHKAKAERIKRLKELMAKPNLSPAHKEHLRRMILELS